MNRYREGEMTSKEVDNMVDTICRRMGNSDNKVMKKFYCKVCWNVPNAMIWDCVELAISKGKNKPAYLTYLFNQELLKRKM